MMRRVGLVFALLIGLAFAVIAFLPLRMVLPDGPAYVREAHGTIWKGRLTGVRLGPLALGDFNTRFNGTTLALEDGARLSAKLDPFAAGIALSEVQGDVDAGVPLLGPLKLSNVVLDMPPAGCRQASGRVTVGLSRSIPGIPTGQLLSGSPQCEKGDLVLGLASQAGLERVELRMRPDFSHELALLIRPSEPLLVPLLQAAGFVETPTGYRLRIK